LLTFRALGLLGI